MYKAIRATLLAVILVAPLSIVGSAGAEAAVPCDPAVTSGTLTTLNQYGGTGAQSCTGKNLTIAGYLYAPDGHFLEARSKTCLSAVGCTLPLGSNQTYVYTGTYKLILRVTAGDGTTASATFTKTR